MKFPTQLCGDYVINLEIRIPIKQPVFHGKYPRGPCFVAHLFHQPKVSAIFPRRSAHSRLTTSTFVACWDSTSPWGFSKKPLPSLKNMMVGRWNFSFWNGLLGGGFKYFLFSPRKLGKWSNFDEHIFQLGWFNHQLEPGPGWYFETLR